MGPRTLGRSIVLVSPVSRRWALVVWIFVISAIAYLDRVNISIAGPDIKREFHLDDIHLGWIFSAFVLGYALFQAPAGRLADKIGPRRMIAFAVVWWAIFTTLLTFVPVAGALGLAIAVRFLLGAGEAVVYPASNRVVAGWVPPSQHGIANGIIFAGVGFGAGVTPPLITSVITHAGWRASFWVSAALGLVAGLIWYAIARDRPSSAPKRALRMNWPEMLSKPALWLISFAYFAYGYAAYIFFSWFFIYLKEVRGLNLKQSAIYSMLPFIGMACASPLGGLLSDVLTNLRGRYVGRSGVAFLGMALAAVLLAFGPRMNTAQSASWMLAGGAAALYLSQSSFWSVTADLGGESAGAMSGFMNMCGQFGGVLTASLTPVIAKHMGWSASFFAAALLCALGAFSWLAVRTSNA